MFRNITKKILAGVMLASFFLIDNVANAYDLPEIKIEKPKKSTKNKTTTEKNDKTKKSVPLMDKNYIFIGKYKGMNYYLDRYSIKIKKNKSNTRSWTQFIFPIGVEVKPINSRSTLQKFFFDGESAYNSTRKKNLIDEIENEEDKNFLMNCFKIGYQTAFDESIK